MRRENAGLTFKTENGAVNVRFSEQHAGVVGQITRGEIVRAVHYDVVWLDNLKRVFAGESRVVEDDFDGGVDAVDGFFGRLRFGPAHVGVRVQNLALEIGEIHVVEVNNAELADASGGEIHGDGRAESARADTEDAGGADFLLAGQTDFGKNQVPRVTANLFVA